MTQRSARPNASTIRPTRARGWQRVAVAVSAALVVAIPAQTAFAAAPVSVLHVGRATAQDVAPRPGSEPDTVVEPDVAVSPLNRLIAVAASHDGRYPDGGAVAISYAWTHDGGATWHHRPLPGLTTSTGGRQPWVRASDPIVAFGPDGDVYISTLLIALTCPSAVAVSRSTDGGKTFAAPVLAHYSAECSISDDKNSLVVDTSPTSPHRGRLYQFWTPFLTDVFGNADGSPQALVYSDDHGATWSHPVSVSRPHANTQNSTPMLRPDGTIVDAFIDYGNQAQVDEDIAFRHHESTRRAAAKAAPAPPPLIRTAISTNGGKSFAPGGVVTADLGPGPDGIRCCLQSSTSDPRTGALYTAWNSNDQSKVRLSASTDGVHWSAPVLVNRRVDSTRYGVNVDVAAYGAVVSVSYGLTNADTTHGRFAQQYIATSRNGGKSFISTIAVGPRSNYAYAAQARGIFPGDYIGTAMTHGRFYAVWCVSSQPPTTGAKYHQVVYAAVLGV
ncbi:MAG: glycoside hydrolase [Actinomycetota bacterium]|nr:glycoside hydrolase [Actinomycetota bacterium]